MTSKPKVSRETSMKKSKTRRAIFNACPPAVRRHLLPARPPVARPPRPPAAVRLASLTPKKHVLQKLVSHLRGTPILWRGLQPRPSWGPVQPRPSSGTQLYISNSRSTSLSGRYVMIYSITKLYECAKSAQQMNIDLDWQIPWLHHFKQSNVPATAIGTH